MPYLWAISDLHLCFSDPSKNMDNIIKNGLWENYQDKIKKNWEKVVNEDDFVIIAGDISWGIKLEQAVIDLNWIDNLPGKKLIIKGNHDLWWSTTSKLKKYLPKSIEIIGLEPIIVGQFCIAGTRFWESPETDYIKLINWNGPKNPRSLTNLDISIFEREKKRVQIALSKMTGKHKIFVSHFPTIDSDMNGSSISSMLEEHKISFSIFGHAHNLNTKTPFGERNGIKYLLTSADFLGFCPLKISALI